MASIEELLSCYQFLGVTPKQEVLDKSVEMCRLYNLKAEDFVDQWSAYAISHSKNVSPTIELLVAMERKEFVGQVDAVKTITVSGTNVQNKNIAKNLDAEDISLYVEAVPNNSNKGKRCCSPVVDGSEPKRIQLNFNRDACESESTYTKRSDSHEPILSFGSERLLKEATYGRKSNGEACVKLFSKQQLNVNVRYMYEVMRQKSDCLNAITHMLGSSIMKKFSVNKEDGSKVTMYGKICCDAEGKLNAASIMLENPKELYYGDCVPLNMSKLKSYSVFPGQVAAVQGHQIKEGQLVVHGLYTSAILNLHEEIPDIKAPVTLIAAAGPFTLSENLFYEPLNDILKYVSERKPDVLVLIGPFLDAAHKHVTDGILMENYESFFESLIESVMSKLANLGTQVVVVASSKDAHHHVVYPTPPYSVWKKYSNLHFVPDPCILDIDGVLIGATSADILFHMAKEEISCKHGDDRIQTLATHLFNQRCFYPLYPPDKDMSIDYELLSKFGILDVVPHIMILPSAFKHFIKNVNGCVVINPEQLAKENSGGNFAQMEIHPTSRRTITDCIACQIVKI